MANTQTSSQDEINRKGASYQSANFEGTNGDYEEDVKNFTAKLIELGSEKGRDMLRYMKEWAADPKRMKEAVEEKVAHHPYISLVSVFAIGYLLGKFLDRR